MIPAKFDSYNVINSDGTTRYTRHQDGSILLPSFLWMDTNEDVIADLYTALGIAAPTRPTPPDPDVEFQGQTQPSQGWDQIQVSDDGFVRLGDRVRLGSGLDLVAALETLTGAAVNTTRIDTTKWSGKVYLPTGQEISYALEALASSTAIPADTFAPTKPVIIDCEIDYGTLIDLDWIQSEDAGGGVTGYRIYVDTVLNQTVADVTNATVDVGSTGTHSITIEAFDGASNVSPLSEPCVVTVPAATSTTSTEAGTGSPYAYTHAGNAPAATAPQTVPTGLFDGDVVIERFDDVVRVWSFNDPTWTKSIEYPIAAGADFFEKVANKAARNSGTKAHGFMSFVGTNQVLYRWDNVGSAWEIADMIRTGTAAQQAAISEQENYQVFHNVDINRSFFWEPAAPLGADWMELR